ncbi:MAG: 2,6-beta-D-fructofuranosidase [Pseudopedobacter saltans]|uniref:2,6-beta-D-fructofuranosidase n=1 Tax=Pseudopedobacter saltans TaxID=151895 RepID=A0A2W5F3R1_9SPHI|nr:MAG: 2,6-beta-D-fructofuranosidase [Pseudopedobacter saltans]
MKCKNVLLFSIALVSGLNMALAQTKSFKITKRYLNFPISQKQKRQVMKMDFDGKNVIDYQVRLSDTPEYWVFYDVLAYEGKTITISYDSGATALDKIYQDDKIAGQDSLYKEINRPQFHFTTRRGWINDPNGLIFYEGEYHLFYQHNPFEKEWENMSWGHAVSKDLIHWEELTLALNSDSLGTMFSGSAIIDYDNTAGFNKGKTPAMIAFYTVDNPEKEIQCMAYSLDKGRTWTKYDKNPVIDSKEKWHSKDTRDPKVFWYAPGKHWVLVLNERDGHSIYNSTNLKDWTYQSHTTGFWECPELFELAIDGNPNNKKWVMYGASGTYMIGHFDGKKFTPEAGKYLYTTGSIYAAQTYTNIPQKDGRRIQIGWGRISHPNMPFNGMMLLPTELTLKNTKEGVRLACKPITETEMLFSKKESWQNLEPKAANNNLMRYHDSATLRLKTTIHLSHATSAGLSLFGQNLIDYDMNNNTINGIFYSPQDRTSMELTADIYIDKTSIEVFIDNGLYSYSMERRPDKNNNAGFQFWGNNIEVKNLELFDAKSIWNK